MDINMAKKFNGKVRKDLGKFRKDLTGKVFGRLKVIKFDSWVVQGKNNRVTYWECLCECGSVKKVKGTHLTRGDTQSCGCYKPGRLPEGEAALNSLLASYKLHAKRREYTFYLTKDDFSKLTKQNCYYCGKEPSQVQTTKRGNGVYIYNGIDRVNNEPFYAISNCVPCCGICNRMKSDLTKEQFLWYIRIIYESNRS